MVVLGLVVLPVLLVMAVLVVLRGAVPAGGGLAAGGVGGGVQFPPGFEGPGPDFGGFAGGPPQRGWSPSDFQEDPMPPWNFN